MKGKFITFEGCEGVGKSRQISLLEEYLKNKSIKYTLTREPGGNFISEQIRKVILDSNNIGMTDECEALLYSASRAQLIKSLILPLISKRTVPDESNIPPSFSAVSLFLQLMSKSGIFCDDFSIFSISFEE